MCTNMYDCVHRYKRMPYIYIFNICSSSARGSNGNCARTTLWRCVFRYILYVNTFICVCVCVFVYHIYLVCSSSARGSNAS